MPNYAIAVNDAVEVLESGSIDGESYLTTSCADFDAFSALPVAVTFLGVELTRTGWCSDTQRAFYKSGRVVARRAATREIKRTSALSATSRTYEPVAHADARAHVARVLTASKTQIEVDTYEFERSHAKTPGGVGSWAFRFTVGGFAQKTLPPTCAERDALQLEATLGHTRDGLLWINASYGVAKRVAKQYATKTFVGRDITIVVCS